MGSIVLDHVSVSFGEKPVFKDLSVSLERGRIHVVSGPSGIGKTTFLRLLLGLEVPGSGCIAGLEGLKKAAVFQEPRLAENLSAVANVRLASGCTAQEARQLLIKLGLGEELAQAVRNLSGGQAQRVSLARAALAGADLLCMDEPLSGLDDVSRRQTVEALKPYLAKATVVWVSHDVGDTELLGDVCMWKLTGTAGATMSLLA